MGIIINQSSKNLVTTYLGFGIGAINTLFLYTQFLEPEYYGLVGFLLSAANLIWPLMAFGVHNTLVKFYSSYQTNEEKDKLLSMVLFLPLLVALVLGCIGFLTYDLILDYFLDKNELVQPFVWMILVIAIATAYFEVFFSWSKVNYHSSFGNFLKEVFHRVCVSILLLGVFFKWLSVEAFIYSLTIVYVLRALIMMFYAFSLYSPVFSFSLPKNSISILKYSSLILIAGSVAMVLLDLDKVMIEYYLPIENVAIYGIAVYMAYVIAVPARAMHQITYALTAIMLNNKDNVGLKDLYQKSSINLLIISGFIFLLIVNNLSEIYELIPDDYQISFSIIFLISAAKLFDSLLGNNNSILFNSDYYRLVLFIGVVLAILAFVFNVIFIPEFGLFGAALATFLAFAIYNTAKIIVVKQKFHIQPFTIKTMWGLILIFVFCLAFYFWDFHFHPIANILLKSALIAAFYLPLIYFLNLSPDINIILNKYFRRKKA